MFTTCIYDIPQIFQQNVLALDMASKSIQEGQVSYNKEQEVYTGFTIEETGESQQACQTPQEQNLLHNVDCQMEGFFDLQQQERRSNSNVKLYAS